MKAFTVRLKSILWGDRVSGFGSYPTGAFPGLLCDRGVLQMEQLLAALVLVQAFQAWVLVIIGLNLAFK